MNYREYNMSEFHKWKSDRGDQTLRLEYPLDENSIVIDCGGYHGDWSQKIWDLYGCKIYIFEPISKYYNLIKNRFSGNDKVHVIHSGLSNKKREEYIEHSNDSSSVFSKSGGEKEKINLISLVEFLKNKKIDYLDLIKINIEGGEFDLLEDVIENDVHKRIKNIQVQFHVFVPDCTNKRNNIREELKKTHEITYDYEFIWENWKLKN